MPRQVLWYHLARLRQLCGVGCAWATSCLVGQETHSRAADLRPPYPTSAGSPPHSLLHAEPHLQKPRQTARHMSETGEPKRPNKLQLTSALSVRSDSDISMASNAHVRAFRTTKIWVQGASLMSRRTVLLFKRGLGSLGRFRPLVVIAAPWRRGPRRARSLYTCCRRESPRYPVDIQVDRRMAAMLCSAPIVKMDRVLRNGPECVHSPYSVIT